MFSIKDIFWRKAIEQALKSYKKLEEPFIWSENLLGFCSETSK